MHGACVKQIPCSDIKRRSAAGYFRRLICFNLVRFSRFVFDELLRLICCCRFGSADFLCNRRVPHGMRRNYLRNFRKCRKTKQTRCCIALYPVLLYRKPSSVLRQHAYIPCLRLRAVPFRSEAPWGEFLPVNSRKRKKTA